MNYIQYILSYSCWPLKHSAMASNLIINETIYLVPKTGPCIHVYIFQLFPTVHPSMFHFKYEVLKVLTYQGENHQYKHPCDTTSLLWHGTLSFHTIHFKLRVNEKIKKTSRRAHMETWHMPTGSADRRVTQGSDWNQFVLLCFDTAMRLTRKSLWLMCLVQFFGPI